MTFIKSIHLYFWTYESLKLRPDFWDPCLVVTPWTSSFRQSAFLRDHGIRSSPAREKFRLSTVQSNGRGTRAEKYWSSYLGRGGCPGHPTSHHTNLKSSTGTRGAKLQELKTRGRLFPDHLAVVIHLPERTNWASSTGNEIPSGWPLTRGDHQGKHRVLPVATSHGFQTGLSGQPGEAF